MASWKLCSLRRQERTLTEEGIALCPCKINKNNKKKNQNLLCAFLSYIHKEEELQINIKKERNVAFFETPHDIKVIPIVR